MVTASEGRRRQQNFSMVEGTVPRSRLHGSLKLHDRNQTERISRMSRRPIETRAGFFQADEGVPLFYNRCTGAYHATPRIELCRAHTETRDDLRFLVHWSSTHPLEDTWLTWTGFAPPDQPLIRQYCASHSIGFPEDGDATATGHGPGADEGTSGPGQESQTNATSVDYSQAWFQPITAESDSTEEKEESQDRL